VGSINYMFFEMGFEGSTSLTYVRFSTRSKGFGKLLGPTWVRFVFSSSKELFKGFIGFEHSFDILLSQDF
jgi:hypothetical protein